MSNAKLAPSERGKLKTTSLTQLKDTIIGKPGTPDRDDYEQKLSLEMLGETLKAIRQQKGLTQEQLGSRIGVKKAQVSKLEHSMNNASINTIIKAFRALNADLVFNVISSKGNGKAK